MLTRTLMITMLAFSANAGALAAGPPMPNEFESAGHALGPIFAYFGGVSTWGTTPSAQTIHSGGSLEVWANLNDDLFSFAGFAVGTFTVNGADLNVPATADTFSVTIEAPTNGQLSFYAVLREDDDGDGVADANDDQWESDTIMLEPGTTVYNIPLASFTLADAGGGNEVQNFATTGTMGYHLVFETADVYPGGRVIEPVSFLIDHLGLYEGAQELPTNGHPADLDGDGLVGFADLLALISVWGPCASCPADLNGDGNVGFDDLLTLISAWS